MPRLDDLKRIPRDIAARARPVSAVGGGAGGIANAKGDLPPLVRSIFPPWMVPPQSAIPFYIEGNQSFAGATIASAFTGALATLAVPSGMVGWVREFTVYVNNLLVTSDIQFNLLIGGRNVPGYSKLQMPQVPSAVYAYSPDNVYGKIDDGQPIGVTVTIGDTVTYSLSFQARGWYYSKAVAVAWEGTG